MRDAGVRVGLGVDGSASNDAGHLLSEARMAMLLQRVRGGADAMSAREALEIATRGGAEVLGRGAELGSIEPGKRADLAIWDVSGIEAAGTWDPVAALLLAGPFRVRDLIVEGRQVVRDGTPHGRRSRRGARTRKGAPGPSDGLIPAALPIDSRSRRRPRALSNDLPSQIGTRQPCPGLARRRASPGCRIPIRADGEARGRSHCGIRLRATGPDEAVPRLIGPGTHTGRAGRGFSLLGVGSSRHRSIPRADGMRTGSGRGAAATRKTATRY